MAFAETANLAVKLTLGGNFTSQMAKAQKSLRTFDKESRAFRAGAQIGTGIKRSAILVVAGATAMVGALALAVKEGQEAANVQKIFAQAVKTSGKVSQDNVDALNKQATALMNLAGIDDELIKSSQTRLVQMGLTGKQIQKATPLVLDFAKATGIDLLTATKLFGKAAQGNIGALSRYGVQVDKAKAKVDPFGAAVDALNKKFGGTTQALSGSFDTRLGALRENLKNIREDVGIKLLPALTRIVDVVGTKLVPAFGKFVDRILPDISKGLDEFADALSNGGAESAIRGITDALGPMVELVKIAAQPVKEIVKAFLGLPKEVQTVLVGAFAVNKLTGGLVTNVGGGIIESIGKSLIGGIKAPLVNVSGGVVNVGGVPGGPAGIADAASKGLSGLSKVFLVGEAIGLGAAVFEVQQAVSKGNSDVATAVTDGANKWIATQPPRGELQTALDGVNRGIHDLEFNPLNVLVQGDALDQLRALRAQLTSKLGATIGHAVNEATKDRDQSRPRTSAQTKDRDQSNPRSSNQVTKDRDQTRKLEELHTIGQRTAAAVKDADSTIDVRGKATVSAEQRSASSIVNAERSGSGAIVAAVRSIPAPVTNVTTNVSLTAGGLTKTVTVTKRYGPVGGSRVVDDGVRER